MNSGLAQVPICLDGRLLSARGMGASTYAANVRRALDEAGLHPLVLHDRWSCRPPAAKSRRERWRRWLATRFGGDTVVHRDGPTLLGRDIFRLGQTRFDLSGDLLKVRAPFEGGIMHWTYPVPIHLAGWANVYTVHDVIPLLHPNLTPISQHRHRRLLERISKTAAGFITVSDQARRDIEEALPDSRVPVWTCGEAVPAECVTPASLPRGLELGAYFVVCGTVEPRKNVGRLIEAWEAAGTALPLVLVGPDGWRAETFAGAIAQAGVMRLPYVERAELVRLIAGARALLMPSLAEGFGIPIVEAMGLGTPVLTSAGGATEEIAAGAAELVDPLDVDAMRQAIGRLAVDNDLCRRLAAAGRRRASDHSPAIFAERIQGAYARVIV